MPVAVALAVVLAVVMLTATGCVNDIVFTRGGSGVLADVAAADAEPPADAFGYVGSGTTTFYAQDPLRSTFDFERNAYGGVVQDGSIVNAGAHLAFGTYEANAFTAGIQGGERAVLLDLGTDDEVAARIGVSQTVGGGQGFAALTVADARSFNDPEASRVFTDAAAPRASVTAAVSHVYVLRVVRDDGRPDLLVKMLAVLVDAGRTAQIQWIRLG